MPLVFALVERRHIDGRDLATTYGPNRAGLHETSRGYDVEHAADDIPFRECWSVVSSRSFFGADLTAKRAAAGPRQSPPQGLHLSAGKSRFAARSLDERQKRNVGRRQARRVIVRPARSRIGGTPGQFRHVVDTPDVFVASVLALDVVSAVAEISSYVL